MNTRINMFGINFDNLTLAETVSAIRKQIDAFPTERKSRYLGANELQSLCVRPSTSLIAEARRLPIKGECLNAGHRY